MLIRSIATATIVSGFAASAGAATLVDFTDNTVWSGSNAGATTTAQGVTLSSFPANFINFNEAYDGPQDATSTFCTSFGGSPLACLSDGVGVAGDEIEERVVADPANLPPNQSITVTFDNGPVNVVGLHFLDLFKAEGDIDQEFANVYINGDFSTNTSFAAKETFDDLGGYSFEATTFTNVSSITFFATRANDEVGVGDYALAGIEFTPIPLPAAAWMLMAALGGLGALSRRKAA